MADSTQNETAKSATAESQRDPKKYIKKKSSESKRKELIIEPPKDYPIQAKIKGISVTDIISIIIVFK